MDWRPFASSFVPNTYEDFCKKVDTSLDLFRPRENTRSPLFFYRPSEQEVEHELQKFQDLKKHVIHQRKQIKLKDTLLSRAREQREREHSKRLLEAKTTRRAFIDQMRSFASSKARPITTTYASTSLKPIRKQKTEDEEESTFFALTAAEDKKVLRESLLPPIRGARSEENAGDLSFFSRRAK